MKIPKPTVTANWLYENLSNEKLIVLDATMNKVFNSTQKQILGTRYFDIKHKFSDTSNPFPNAFPSAEVFQNEAQQLGINKDSIIVVYDDKGIYSSARVWWMFKAFGHEEIAVLDGGFPAWKEKGFPTENHREQTFKIGNFVSDLNAGYICFFEDMKHKSNDASQLVIDARSKERFHCEEPEPREGLRMGTIPNSKNIPYTEVLHNGKLRSEDELNMVFKPFVKTNQPITFSCGSGITACVLALAAYKIGLKNFTVYDGSWTEWGTLVK